MVSKKSKKSKRDEDVVDRLITRLMNELGHQPKPQRFKIDDLAAVNERARAVFHSQPMLLEIDPPTMIAGDTHGQFYDLLRLFDFCGDPRQNSYLFLGDYVDRGQLGLELITLLLCLKVKRPNHIWLLRGNHESAQVNEVYGFANEMRLRFGVDNGSVMWRDYCKTFNWMPVSALVGKKILCMHGGLSPDLNSFDDIRRLPRPREVPDYGLMCDMLWSDPSSDDGWEESKRGLSFYFSNKQIDEACRRLKIQLIVRGHEQLPDGFRFSGSRLLSLFSAPNCGGNEFNRAAVLKVRADFLCSFMCMAVDDALPIVYKKPNKTNMTSSLKSADV